MRYFKLFFSVILASFSFFILASCSSEGEALTVAAPSGAPGLAHASINNTTFDVDGKKYTVKVNKIEPKALPTAFKDQTYDFITAPVNVGVKFASNYNLLARITAGNIFLVSKAKLTEPLPNGRKVYSFFPKGSSVNSMLLENSKALGADYVVNATYDPNTNIVAGDNKNLFDVIKESTDEIFVIAEPKLTIFKNTNSEVTLNELDLFEQFKPNEFIQAATFVSTKLDKKVASKVNELLKASAEAVNDDTKVNDVFKKAVELQLFPEHLGNTESVKNAFKRSHVAYLDGDNLKKAFNALVGIAKDTKSNVFKNPDGTYISYTAFFEAE